MFLQGWKKKKCPIKSENREQVEGKKRRLQCPTWREAKVREKKKKKKMKKTKKTKKMMKELTQSVGTSGDNGTGGRRNGRMMHWGKNEVRGRREGRGGGGGTLEPECVARGEEEEERK